MGTFSVDFFFSLISFLIFPFTNETSAIKSLKPKQSRGVWSSRERSRLDSGRLAIFSWLTPVGRGPFSSTTTTTMHFLTIGAVACQTRPSLVRRNSVPRLPFLAITSEPLRPARRRRSRFIAGAKVRTSAAAAATQGMIFLKMTTMTTPTTRIWPSGGSCYRVSSHRDHRHRRFQVSGWWFFFFFFFFFLDFLGFLGCPFPGRLARRDQA